MTASLRSLASPRIRASLLIVLAALPPIYLLIAIQYSAITVPFWDHTEIIQRIASWQEGTFSFLNLGAPHNHTRPFFYRLVMVGNAIATDWDVRSEYIYLYLAIYGSFACFAWLACRIVVGEDRRSILPLTLLALSLLAFSPVGHNNHWWSMMFQLDATHFFIALSMALVFARPTSWISHVVAAASCWLAAYTLTNGFFAMAAIMVTLQLSAPRLLRPDRFAVFWAVNLLVAAICYLPGMNMERGSTHPAPLQLIEFSLAYLGAPFGGLLWFPYRNMFHLPLSTAFNVICGIGLLINCAVLSWNALPRLRQRHPAALALFGFAGFAVLSAVATGWARAAFDQFGPANGNASRYTIFGAGLLLGQIYYVGAGLAQNWWGQNRYPLLSRRAVFSLSAIFIVAAFVSYGRSWRVYADAHDFNRNLAQAYVWGLKPVEEDRFIHPRPATVTMLKTKLQQFELGPYANRAYDRVPFAIGKFSKPAYLSGRRTVSQRFTATENGLKRLSLKLTIPNGVPAKGPMTWTLTEVGSSTPVASAVIDGERVRDWMPVRLKLPYIADSKGKTYELTFAGTGDDRGALGLPLYEPVEGSAQPIVQSDEDEARRGRDVMDLTVEYAK